MERYSPIDREQQLEQLKSRNNGMQGESSFFSNLSGFMPPPTPPPGRAFYRPATVQQIRKKSSEVKRKSVTAKIKKDLYSKVGTRRKNPPDWLTRAKSNAQRSPLNTNRPPAVQFAPWKSPNFRVNQILKRRGFRNFQIVEEPSSPIEEKLPTQFMRAKDWAKINIKVRPPKPRNLLFRNPLLNWDENVIQGKKIEKKDSDLSRELKRQAIEQLLGSLETDESPIESRDKPLPRVLPTDQTIGENSQIIEVKSFSMTADDARAASAPQGKKKPRVIVYTSSSVRHTEAISPASELAQ